MSKDNFVQVYDACKYKHPHVSEDLHLSADREKIHAVSENAMRPPGTLIIH